MRTEDLLRQIREQSDSLLGQTVEGSLLLVDLVDSTRFKTKHPEYDWLNRLLEFREAVKSALQEVKPVKYLGDGVLCFFPKIKYQADAVCEFARKMMGELAKINAGRNYTGDFPLRCRIIIDYGHVHMFDDTDPQGTPVDRLFRLEKHVPQTCIAVTEDFRRAANLLSTSFSLGKYLIRGIGGGRHELFLLDKPSEETHALVEKQQELSALTDIWSLGVNYDGPIFVVGGRIPGPEAYAVQSGDKDALVEAVLAIAKAGRMDDVQILTGTEPQETYLRENIVTIGGPYYNSWTRRVMRECKSPLIFDLGAEDIPLINRARGTVLRALRSGDRVVRDHGFIARLRNPMNPEKHVMMACGIETYGVLGAIHLLAGLRGNVHFLKLHEHIIRTLSGSDGGLRDFFLSTPFEVNEHGAIEMDTLDVQTSGLISDWSSLDDSRVQEPPPAD